MNSKWFRVLIILSHQFPWSSSIWQVFHTDISCFADLRTAISGRFPVKSRQEPISGGFLANDVAKNTCQFEGRKRPAGKSV